MSHMGWLFPIYGKIKFMFHDWLVIDIPTPLKNMTSSVGMDGTSQSMESHKIHVSNHQAAILDTLPKEILMPCRTKVTVAHTHTHTHILDHVGSYWLYRRIIFNSLMFLGGITLVIYRWTTLGRDIKPCQRIRLVNTGWGPSSFAELVQITLITIVSVWYL